MQSKGFLRGLSSSVLVLFFISYAWLTVQVKTMNSGRGEETLLLEEPAPDFTLKDLEGEEWSLSELKGKVVVINFWATWCPPCRAEMPMIQTVYREYREQGLEVLSIDVRESEKTVRKFIEENGVDFPILMDEEGEVSELYNISAFPTTFVIDTRGVVKKVYVGLDPFFHSTLTGMIKALLPDTTKANKG